MLIKVEGEKKKGKKGKKQFLQSPFITNISVHMEDIQGVVYEVFAGSQHDRKTDILVGRLVQDRFTH